jgi:hypothetical protein
MTPLDKTLKRSITINGSQYVITLSPSALKVTLKGRRLGVELRWPDLVSGESALAVALHASIGKFQSKSPRNAQPLKSPGRADVHRGRADVHRGRAAVRRARKPRAR